MITIWTQAYNTEEYVRQCIESVLNQTYTDFEYILVDNGSTDRTGKIIDEYAARDKRIRAFHEKENYRGARYNLFLNNMRGEYFAALDSDDWLENNYLQLLYQFCKEEELDMCVCGSRYYIEKNGMYGVLRQPQLNLTFTYNEIPIYFSKIHAFLRTTWGKLIRTETIRDSDLSLFQHFTDMHYNGSDTAFSIGIFENCRKVGMLNGCFHNYRIRENSVFSEYRSERYDAYEKLYNQTTEIISKFEFNKNINQRFTSLVFFNAIKDIFDICVRSNLSNPQKVMEIIDILNKPKVMELRETDIENEGKKILMPYIGWVLNSDGIKDNSYEKLKKILYFVHPTFYKKLTEDELNSLLNYHDIIINIILEKYKYAYERLVKLSEINLRAIEFFCLSNIKDNDLERLNYYLQAAERYKTIQPLKSLIKDIFRKNEILEKVEVSDEISSYSYVVEAIFKREYNNAINYASELLHNSDFIHRQPLADLMRLVSAVYNDSAAFVYFSKVRAIELLSAKLIFEAEGALTELQKMTPNDPDLQVLMEYLTTLQEER